MLTVFRMVFRAGRDPEKTGALHGIRRFFCKASVTRCGDAQDLFRRISKGNRAWSGVPVVELHTCASCNRGALALEEASVPRVGSVFASQLRSRTGMLAASPAGLRKP